MPLNWTNVIIKCNSTTNLEYFKVLWIDFQKVTEIRGAFNRFPKTFVRAFKIVVDSWKFSMLLLYILWDDGLIFMISDSYEQLQQ